MTTSGGAAPITPDTKDWTWVLDKPCPECGYDASTVAVADLAHRIRTMRLHGFDRDGFDRYRSERPAWHYDVVEAGFKYNLTDPAAALGLVQLSRA